MSKEIRQYIRNKDRSPKGVFIAVRDSNMKDVVSIGWSLCHKNDKYDKARAEQIAYNRALKYSTVAIPQSICMELDNFVSRCERYFKTTNISVGEYNV